MTKIDLVIYVIRHQFYHFRVVLSLFIDFDEPPTTCNALMSPCSILFLSARLRLALWRVDQNPEKRTSIRMAVYICVCT